MESKKDDDEAFVPFQGLEKGAVLQEKRLFNETPLNHRKCCQLITKLLYLINQGEKFTTTEATDVFFAVTKLFQSKDIPLRRMVYLVLKELTTMSNDVIIVMSSLTKDMNSKVDFYRANAIRVLTGITDTAMLGSVERYLKQAIVDKDPYVASAALVSGTHLMTASGDIVKRWVSEVQEALQSKSVMVQYHALGLLYRIKQHDRLAIAKLVTSMTKSSIRSPYAHCLLIKFTTQVMEEDPNAAERGFFAYLETCLRHKSDMVIYEAARAICNLKNVTSRELTPAITVLQLFLSSPKPSLRFAAVRTLNKVAQTHPLSVTTCNLDMENLIADTNRSIATLAITTLLKTGSESSVDRLMKQITAFMGDISDEFKIVVVDAIRTLCIKFPLKQRSLLNFLSNILRDEGGFEFKKSIVDTILFIIKEIPESKESGLTHLCEFIEDCEFTQLSTKILNLLGREGPNTSVPSRYIRYIYNRISLENGNVRGSAVSALAKFAVKLDSLRPAIITLLRRCLIDGDDEVRDRAIFYLEALEKDKAVAKQMVVDEFPYPMANLERALQEYQKDPSSTPFDLVNVSVTPVTSYKEKEKEKKEQKKQVPAAGTETSQDMHSAILASVPQFANYGPLFTSSKPVQLTESELEYVVTCTKHTFAAHIVLQFTVKNTLEEQLLENVVGKVDVSGLEGASVAALVPLESLPFDNPGITWVSLKKAPNGVVTGAIQASLKFTVKEVDPQTGEAEDTGYEEDYQLEDVDITTADYMQKTYVGSFEEKWAELGDEFEVVQVYALSTVKTLQDAVDSVTKFLGMQPVERSDKVPAKRTKHILYLAGNFIGGVPVLVRCRMKAGDQGVQIELAARSTDVDVSSTVAAAI